MLEIRFQDIPISKEIEELLRASSQAIFMHTDIDEKDRLSIMISTDFHLQELNRTFRGIDEPTDVLSFPNDEISSNRPSSNKGRILGDIAISLNRAAAQAKQRGHSLEAELQLLFIHGVLHLIGHDHVEKTEKQNMWALQDQILDSLKVEMDRLRIGE